MIYLDNAATSFPKAPLVGTVIKECIENYGINIGRGSYELADLTGSKVIQGRMLIKELFNIDSLMNIIYTNNATEGINLALSGLLKKGDHVITTSLEHNSVLRPLKHLEEKDVKTTIVPINEDGEIDIKIIKNSIKKQTRLIVITHISNVLGKIQDIETIGDICRQKGIIFMVDGSQSVGKIPMDVKKNNINILAFPGHKGLLGPQGIGGLYIDRNIEDQINAIKFGGTGSHSLELQHPKVLPDKFESGTLNIPGIIGLSEGIKFINNETLSKIYNKEKELTAYLIEELEKLAFIKIYGNTKKNHLGVVSINIDTVDTSQTGYLLNKNNIAVRTGFHCAALVHKYIGTEKTGTVRVSPGYFNTTKDIDKLIEVLKIIYKY